MIYQPPKCRGDVTVKAAAFERLLSLRQLGWRSSEAGGQLFGHVTGDRWTIAEATGLRKGDIRSLMSFLPNRSAEQKEIDDYYERGLHFLGDWHTHRQSTPVPSSTDVGSMQDMAHQSLQELPCFLLVIVGTTANFADWHLSWHGRENWLTL